ncbi:MULTISPECIES: hypothetical protein [Leptospira]|uniref:Uncharacterized protein n=1 Tax=Leptospira alexanderi serovar Manhao 3 str. L 60 TaxID=1049759 RepID=V6I1S5_9LEPT|nr:MULTISPECIES: hypothetical protein [Leptospira]EQA63791.1 hypothetical protein LEP1GSC062_3909 [Leptospira alexanderi serovar Manhao 3 str. L 60]
MKIRWINEEVKLIPGAPKWVEFTAKYPFVLFLPAAVLFTYAHYWNQWIWMEIRSNGKPSSGFF